MFKPVYKCTTLLINMISFLQEKTYELRCAKCEKGFATIYFPCDNCLAVYSKDELMREYTLNYQKYDIELFDRLLDLYLQPKLKTFNFIKLMSTTIKEDTRTYYEKHESLLLYTVFYDQSIMKSITENMTQEDVEELKYLVKNSRTYPDDFGLWSSMLSKYFIHILINFPSSKLSYAEQIIDNMFNIDENLKLYISSKILANDFFINRKSHIINYYLTIIRTFNLDQIENKYKELLIAS